MSDEPEGPDLATGVSVAGLAEGAMVAGHVADEAVMLARSGGRLYAVSARCTHLGGPLDQGLVVGGIVRCPWHHARFDLASGEAVGAPAFSPLACYRVEERDGRAFVRGREDATPMGTAPAAGAARSVVIIGGGAAGYACAEWLLRSGFTGSIDMISDDTDPPYDRTFCSKDYLEDMAPRGDCPLDDPAIAGDARLRLRLGARVVALNLEARTVRLDDGEEIPFDALVLAMGGQPKRPDLPGFDAANVHLLRTLADADAIIAAAQGAKRAAVLGASFIALEAASALIQRGLHVDVVAPDPVPLAHVLGDAVGGFVRRLHEDRGVVFHLGRKALRLEGRQLTLDDGSVLDVDFVVAGMGVAPRTDLAKDAGLAENNGVVVDALLRASAPGVYAVGDIARFPDPLTGALVRIEHWVHAQRQGQHVARAILGRPEPFVDVPFFWSAHYGDGVYYSGHVEAFDAVEIEGTLDTVPPTEARFTARYRKDGAVVALAAFGDDMAVLEAEADFERRIAARKS